MAKSKHERWIAADGLLLLGGWARDGLTDEQIAKNMGISGRTFYDYIKRFPQISQAIKKGKEIVDIEVENALYKSAIGYEYEEVTKEPQYNIITGEPVLDSNGKQVVAITKIVKKHAQPSNMAQIYWLNNRKRDKWRRNAGKEVLDEKKFEHEQDIDGKRYW